MADQSDVEGADLIAAERRRQIEVEGWTPEHDDKHESCGLAQAAIGYAIFGIWRALDSDTEVAPGKVPSEFSRTWPWSASWWRPSPDPIRNLVKAGALIAAEIDRLQRASAHSAASPSDG